MKNIFKYLTIIICIILITGCGNNKKEQKEELPTDLVKNMNLDDKDATAVCSAEFDYADTQGYATGSKFLIYADEDGIVNKIVSREIVVSNDEEILNLFEDSLNRNYDSFSQYGGYTFKVEIEDNKLTSDVTIEYTETDLKAMAADNETLEIYLNDDNQLTLDSVKAMYISSGATCE